MTVAELIEFLKTQPQNLPVAYSKWSEQALYEKELASVCVLGMPRPDGWVENLRPDRPMQYYLLLL